MIQKLGFWVKGSGTRDWGLKSATTTRPGHSTIKVSAVLAAVRGLNHKFTFRV